MMTNHMFDGPLERVYGILNGVANAETLIEQLHKMGVHGAHIRVLNGTEGSRELDQHGQRGGLMAKIKRALHLITAEGEHIGEYAWALRQGQVVVAVQLPARSEKTAIHAAFRSAQARFVHHYGAWVVQKLVF
jgi:hypothetical protein